MVLTQKIRQTDKMEQDRHPTKNVHISISNWFSRKLQKHTLEKNNLFKNSAGKTEYSYAED
jgi:hypothetical protein